VGEEYYRLEKCVKKINSQPVMAVYDRAGSIIGLAVSEGHLRKNPAELLVTPKSIQSRSKLVMSLEEVNKCFSVLADGTLFGTVFDSSGAVVPGVTVTVSTMERVQDGIREASVATKQN
jgi:hypothetical protein